ncbi:RNA dependent RNA polymerase-domain-containing protein, partial [Lophiotrema nucula]
PPSPTPSAGRYSDILNVAKRRSSDSSNDEQSPKLQRTRQGRLSSAQRLSNGSEVQRTPEKRPFKKPSRDMARSYQASSTKTSFATSVDNDLVWSQQGATQPGTANTSFESAISPPPRKPVRSSSTTIGSLDDQTLLDVSDALERSLLKRASDTSRESNSTFYGSIDEQGMVDATTISEAAMSPERLKQPPSNAGSPKESPSKLSHRIRDIPKQGLFVDDIFDGIRNFPYFALFICHRFATERKFVLADLVRHIGDGWSNYDTFRTLIKSYTKSRKANLNEPRGLWLSQDKDFDGYTFKGRIVFNSGRSGRVFGLELLPVQSDRSCRLQRKFGADRFLYLTLPSFESGLETSGYNQVELKQIEDQFKEWFVTPHKFLGRTWGAFHYESIKKKKGARKADANADKRVILFAIEGIGIDKPCSVGELLNWHLPLDRNRSQTFCKAFARIDLALSRTIPTFTFKPSQIRRRPDIRADGTPESTSFNDDSLSWDEEYNDRPVMDDGCARMSVGAWFEVCKMYRDQTGTNDPPPCAFQGRIGGAKGMWVLCAESYSKDKSDCDIWIEITGSQEKFEPHPEDEDDLFPFDPHRLTFEVCRYSSHAVPSELHVSFVQILIDRGVPQEDVADLMRERLNGEREQLLGVIPNPVRAHDWVHKQGSGSREDTLWQAALPLSLSDRLNFQLESGFNPVRAPYLARCLYRFIQKKQLSMERKLRVPLGKSTNLYGIADSLGVLRPGEIHVQFSVPFVDGMTNETYRSLDSLEVLVARQPALRRSDMQKVRAVVHPSLSHLVDVVVFPTKGVYPLAGKLQGGDYDGDIFWLCWEPALVSPFLNAPAPLQALNHRSYRMGQEQRCLQEVMDTTNLSTTDRFLREVIEFQTKPSLLGLVTNFHEKQTYAEGCIHSTILQSLCDIHDLLVDAPKQGYVYSHGDFWKYVKGTLLLREEPKLPAYKGAMDAAEQAKEMGEGDRMRTKDWPIKADSPLDFLYFQVIRRHNDETLRRISEILSKQLDDDPDLRYPCRRLQERGGANIKNALKEVLIDFDGVFRTWNKGMVASQYNSTVAQCYERFRAVMPTTPQDPEIILWLEPFLHGDFSLWELIRASALYTAYPEKHAFVWHMAGRELAYIKAGSQPGSRYLSKAIHANIKPKPVRAPRQFEDDSSDDE